MKIRKLCAVLLALAQIAFGAVLLSRGSAMDKKEEERIQAIIDNGQQILFRLNDFYYHADNDPPLSFSPEYDEDTLRYDRYESIVTDKYGHSVIGEGYDTPPEGPYLDVEIPWVYRLDAKSVRRAFADADRDDQWYFHALFCKSRFNIGGKTVSVYAVGYVKDGALVFTGIMVDGEIY